MNDEKIEKIVLILGFIGVLVLLGYIIMHPTTYYELPLEKRIQYEQLIFP